MNTLSWVIIDGPEWDRLLAGFDGTCQEQLYAFARPRWPSATIEPMLFSRLGEPVGGCLMLVQPLPLCLGSIAVTKWGPVLKHAASPDAATVYSAIIDGLKAEYAERRRMLLSVLPKVSVDEVNRHFASLAMKGFKPGPSLREPERYLASV